MSAPRAGLNVFFCLQVSGTDEDGAVALLYVRIRLVLVEKRGLGWATGRRETQKAMAIFFLNRPLVGILS